MTAAPQEPSPQGLCQVRLLPDPVHYGRSAAVGQYGTRPTERGREEEGLLGVLNRALTLRMAETTSNSTTMSMRLWDTSMAALRDLPAYVHGSCRSSGEWWIH